MNTPQGNPSVESGHLSLSAQATGHLDLLWRELMNAHDAIATDTYFRLVTREPHPLGNVAIFREPNNPDLVLEVIPPLKDLPVPAAVMFVDGVSDAVSERLIKHGFMRHESMPAMTIDLASLRETTLPDGYECVRVFADESEPWADVLIASFGLPGGLAQLLSPERHVTNPAVQFFGIRSKGKIVATSMLYLSDGVAGIYCVATLPEERGRGLGAHVTAEALRVAKPLGCGVGVLQSSPAGYRVYQSLGFRDVGAVPMFVRMPA